MTSVFPDHHSNDLSLSSPAWNIVQLVKSPQLFPSGFVRMPEPYPTRNFFPEELMTGPGTVCGQP